MPKHFFITGTDTGVGKTYATCELLKQFQGKDKTAIAIKPIQCGDIENSDTALLMQHNSVALSKENVTPYTFKLPTSPHIASVYEKTPLTAESIVNACQPALAQDVDVVLIEGTGGWSVPINEFETMADVAKQFDCPVILVVGLRLGCLNHALLTVEAIKAKGIPLHGWIANQIDPKFSFEPEYLNTLKSAIPSQYLAYIPFAEK